MPVKESAEASALRLECKRIAGKFATLAEPRRIEILAQVVTGGLTLQAIADKLKFDKGNVAYHVRALVKAEFIKRRTAQNKPLELVEGAIVALVTDLAGVLGLDITINVEEEADADAETG